jgi:uncharacterized protein YxeA
MNILLIVIIILIIIILICISRNKNIDNFDNLYTYDTCCTETEKQNCMKYGKTGVCNYYKNNNKCLCQNSD